MASSDPAYDPFARGRFPVGVRTIEALDSVRNRRFKCEIWYPATVQHAGQDLAFETQDVFSTPNRNEQRRQAAVRNADAEPGNYPLVVFSHASGFHRRGATFLCTHVASHGYVVAALDHSEVVAPELSPKQNETDAQKAARWDEAIASRVPDVRFLLDQLLDGPLPNDGIAIDIDAIGIVGHSFGGWTALAVPEVDARIRVVVALAPAGSSKPRPGILPVKLTFEWGRDIPTLYLVAENDVALPLRGMYELFERTQSKKQMVVLRRADHAHFMDNVEHEHETIRALPLPPELAYLKNETRPIGELCSGESANLFVRGLTVCHLDAFLKRKWPAEDLLASTIQSELSKRSIDAFLHHS
jgi:dienelactone hydrolase